MRACFVLPPYPAVPAHLFFPQGEAPNNLRHFAVKSREGTALCQDKYAQRGTARMASCAATSDASE
eukprot:1684514-Prorocentrum_lima.AAC.1